MAVKGLKINSLNMSDDVSGLVLLNTTSFSAVGTQSISDVFSTTYDNYRLTLTNIVASGSVELNIRFRISGTDATTNYFWSGISVNDTGVASVTALGGNGANTSARIGSLSTQVKGFDIYIGNPFLSATTQYSSLLGNGGQLLMGKRDGNDSYTGFTLLTSSGTMSGSVSVYGYNK